MNWEEVCHFLAQAAINISEGKHNTFEEGSKIHKALLAFCEYANKGHVTFSAARSVKEGNDA